MEEQIAKLIASNLIQHINNDVFFTIELNKLIYKLSDILDLEPLDLIKKINNNL